MRPMTLLTIQDLHVAINAVGDVAQHSQEILHGLSLTVSPGEIHAVMGPNGSGKSTLVNALAGHPRYRITQGSVQFLGQDLLAMGPHERALIGLFLAMQYPKEIAGVTLRSFLFSAYKAQMTSRHPEVKSVSPIKFKRLLDGAMEKVHMDHAFAERSINKGFSGGEKKKCEVLQMTVLRPVLALLDETDSGLDVDALKIIADGVNAMRSPIFSALIVTHYNRILEYITPDHVHVMIGGRIVESGGADLAKKLEREGYTQYL